MKLTSYEVLVDPTVAAEQAVVATPEDELDLIGARISLAKAEAKLIGEFDSHFRLKDKLAGLRELYDYIVIDTPPTLGILTVNAFVCATHLIVPIQSSYFSLVGFIIQSQVPSVPVMFSQVVPGVIAPAEAEPATTDAASIIDNERIIYSLQSKKCCPT